MEDYSSTTLANGLRVLTYYDPNSPIADINIMVRAGYRYEKPDELGYAHLLEHMLLKGTRSYPAPDLLAAQVSDIGGTQNASTNRERVNYYMVVAREYTEKMIGLLNEMFFESLFDAGQLEKEKAVVLQEYENIRSNNDRFAGNLALKEFFHGHPLGMSVLDADESTKKATSERLRAYMNQWYVPERAAIIIGGGIPHDEAVRMAEKYFGAWQNGGTAPIVPASFTPQHVAHMHITKDIPSTSITLLYHGPDVTEPRAEVALDMLSSFFSYGQASFLMRELRHKRGLVYGASTSLSTDRDTGIFGFDSSTSKDAAEVIGLARSYIEHVADILKPEDVERVRKMKLGAFARNMAETSDRADYLFSNFVTMDRLYHPDEWIQALNAVTYQDILDASAKYLRRDNSMLVTMGRTDPGEL